MGRIAQATAITLYERDIVDRLWGYQREGKGVLTELCTIAVGDRRLPFVAFRTGDKGTLVTARHHVYEFWGTTETVMGLAESGQEGFTLVPVVDVEYFDRAEAKKERILKGGEWAFLADFLWGYKDMPPKVEERDWPYYHYSNGNSPPHIRAIKRLMGMSTMFLDLHNTPSATGYMFMTVPVNPDSDVEVYRKIHRELSTRGQQVRGSNGSNYKSLYVDGHHIDGFHEWFSGNTALDYAGRLGKTNIGFEIPVRSHNGGVHIADGIEFRNPTELVAINLAIISSIGKLVR